MLFYHDFAMCYISNTVLFATNFSTCDFESHDIEPMYWNGIACRTNSFICLKLKDIETRCWNGITCMTNSFIDHIKMPETERH